ncbi:MAG: LemA family protein [Eubacteriales bacterium]|jgi:LemA protein|nr:LemA family protein [Eubacteriales bacterium]
MKNKKWIVLGVVVLLAFLAFSSIKGTYNSLVVLNEEVDSKWSQVENNLQRRADLIPNLVETVKGYAAHEQEVFSDIAEARSRLIGASGANEAAQANDALSNAIGRLLVLSESYPQLKADQNFQHLMDELSGTENRLAVARKDYNDAVRDYNATIQKFPTNIYASMLKYEKRDYFEASESAKDAPKVQF